jgi:hypothetical protein
MGLRTVLGFRKKPKPAENKATAHQYDSVSLESLLALRTAHWWRDPAAPDEVKAVASLVSSKRTMRRYIAAMGIRLPRLYYDAACFDEIDFGSLPDRVVIKPDGGWDSDAVMLFDGNRELLSGKAVSQDQRAAFCRETLNKARFVKPDSRLLVEEFVKDCDERFAIPRDFKVYVAGGHAHVVQVIDRNPTKEQRNSSFYTPHWARIEDRFQTYYKSGPDVVKPGALPAVIDNAERIAKNIGAFLRLDFYVDAEGPVFGEFTSHPFAGLNYTPYGERYLIDLMHRFPDSIPPGWSIERAAPTDVI